MADLTQGELIQASKQDHFLDINNSLEIYLSKTYYKTAALISNSLLGVATINNGDE